jgi:hypothetical protein
MALEAVRQLLANLTGGFLAEGEGYLDALERIARPALLQGAIVHDTGVAALCLYRGVRAEQTGPTRQVGKIIPRRVPSCRGHCATIPEPRLR